MEWIFADRAIVGDCRTVLAPAWIGIEQGIIVAVTTKPPSESAVKRAVRMYSTTLTPGLFDLHGQLVKRRPCQEQSETPACGHWPMIENSHYLILHSVHNARRALREQGITWMRDYGASGPTSVHLQRAINEGLIEGPELSTCGHAICITGGYGYALRREADGVSGVTTAVREEIRAGADVLKFMASGGLGDSPDEESLRLEFSQDELRAGVDAAHDAGKMTTAHCYPSAAMLRAIRAGIDCIEHGVFLDAHGIDLMLRKDIPLVPVMAGVRVACEALKKMPESTRERVLRLHATSVRKAVEAGLRVGIGSGSTGGLSEEIRLLAEVANLSPVQVIGHATGIAATIVRQSNVGLLKPGYRADIAAFTGDLTQSLEGLGAVAQVWKQGVPVL